MTAAGENLSPGERLLQAREKAGLTLPELAERTKIPQASLQAIERDEYHKISGDLYVKSFLRSYAREVGLEPEEMIEVYQVFTGAAATGADGEAKTGWDEKDVQIRNVGLPWIQIGVGVGVALAVLVGVWYLLGRGGDGETAGNEPRTEVAADPAPARPDTSGRDTLALGWQKSTPRVTENSSPRQEKTEVAVPEPELPVALPGGPDLRFASGRSWPFVLRLLVPAAGSYAVMRDAESTFQDARFPDAETIAPLPAEGMKPGTAYAVREGLVVYWGVEDHISLRLGQVAGVRLSFNGKDQDLSRFRDGEVLLLDASVLADPGGE